MMVSISVIVTPGTPQQRVVDDDLEVRLYLAVELRQCVYGLPHEPSKRVLDSSDTKVHLPRLQSLENSVGGVEIHDLIVADVIIRTISPTSLFIKAPFPTLYADFDFFRLCHYLLRTASAEVPPLAEQRRRR